MGGNILRHDCYDIRKFKMGDLDYLIDIGANTGTVSLMAKILFPAIKLIALEPCHETFMQLYYHLKPWVKKRDMCLYNMALGDGSLMSLDIRGGENGGDNRCYSQDERSWWEEGSTMVPSRTLRQIFSDHDIYGSKKYMLKIDCEGGERFLLQDQFREESIMFVRGSVQTVMELHFGIGGSRDQWNQWLDQLRDTHIVKSGGWRERKTEKQHYVFEECKAIEQERGRPVIELISKQWELEHENRRS